MARIATVAVSALSDLMKGADGIFDRLSQTAAQGAGVLPRIEAHQIVERQVAADIAEKTTGVQYPSIQIYCEKVVNDLREKFRRFSGTAVMAIEVRVSHEHMNVMQSELQAYTEAVTDVLDTKRGKLAAGLFYTGGYSIQYGPIKRGGRGFLQAAKVELTVTGSME